MRKIYLTLVSIFIFWSMTNAQDSHQRLFNEATRLVNLIKYDEDKNHCESLYELIEKLYYVENSSFEKNAESIVALLKDRTMPERFLTHINHHCISAYYGLIAYLESVKIHATDLDKRMSLLIYNIENTQGDIGMGYVLLLRDLIKENNSKQIYQKIFDKTKNSEIRPTYVWEIFQIGDKENIADFITSNIKEQRKNQVIYGMFVENVSELPLNRKQRRKIKRELRFLKKQNDTEKSQVLNSALYKK